MQDVLAKALHRLCKIPIKETGNDFQDVKHFEERLNIEIQIYNFESRQIYKGKENLIKFYILMSENHFDVISNIAGFTCANEDRSRSENHKCKACKSETKCNVNEPPVSCEMCNKHFYGKTCFGYHIANKICVEHSYKCAKCHRFYKTQDLPKAKHRCDQIKCGNCK